MTWVWMKRASIHSLIRLTTSLPAIRSSPATNTSTPKSAERRSYWALTRSTRSCGSTALNSSLDSLLPTSDASSMCPPPGSDTSADRTGWPAPEAG